MAASVLVKAYLPRHLVARLIAEASARGVSASSLIREAVQNEQENSWRPYNPALDQVAGQLTLDDLENEVNASQ